VFKSFLISYSKYHQIWLNGLMDELEQHHKVRKKPLDGDDESGLKCWPTQRL
jgi:hypothetical protein